MTECISEYKYDIDDKIELDAIRQFNKINLEEIKKKLQHQENAIKAVNSVILLKECIQLYDKCLKNIDDGNINDYNRNRRELEEKINSFKSDQFIHHQDFRLGVLQEIYPKYNEKELMHKAQVFQTGDIIPFEKLPHRFTELLSQCPSNSRKRQKIQKTSAEGKTKRRKRKKPKKKKLETKKKIDFKKLRKHITQRLKPRFKFKRSKTRNNK
tara:strand:- start:7254 stop:7889 length:636 start_codon:yes stop_codon:yes gene_type:complete